jgi:hypothetical protein
MSREADIAATLSYLDPHVHVEDTSEPDGARITVETGGQTYRFSISKRRSLLLNYLLTGHAT